MIAISDQAFKTLEHVTLQEPYRILFGPSLHVLKVLGQFDGTFQIGQITSTETVFIVSGLKMNFLAIKSLQLLQQVSSVFLLEQTIREKFPMVFQGLGTLGAPYTIKGAQPYAFVCPSNIPFALRDKVRDELHRMESMGVIKKITEPSEWCAGIVVVLKSTEAVRICVDLNLLNTSVLREPYTIPTVDKTLAQLPGATIFSKVNANSGFWQIPLAAIYYLISPFV